MNENLLLVAVLFGLYVTDCLLPAARPSVTFVRWWGRRFAARPPHPVLRTMDAGLVPLNPLPPLGEAYSCPLPPFTLDVDGLRTINPLAAEAGDDPVRELRLIPWDQITRVEADKRKVMVNGEEFARGPDPETVREWTGWITDIVRTAQARRPDRIRDFYRRSFDRPAAQARLDALARWRPRFKNLAHVLLIYLFCGVPLLILGMGRVQWFWPLAAGLFLLSAGTSALFHRAHRELHPQRGADRFSGLMKMILYPPAAIRVWDILTAPLLAGYHPLMVGRLLLGSDDFQTFAGRWVRAMRYPIVTGPAARGAADPEAWGAAQRTVAMEFLARETDITADWFAPPKADGAVAWCPRCQATFTQDAGDCPDCPGVGLRPFGPLQSASDREEGT